MHLLESYFNATFPCESDSSETSQAVSVFQLLVAQKAPDQADPNLHLPI